MLQQCSVQVCYTLFAGDIRDLSAMEKQEFSLQYNGICGSNFLHLGKIGKGEALTRIILRNQTTSINQSLSWPADTEFRLICGDGCGVHPKALNANIGQVDYKEFA